METPWDTDQSEDPNIAICGGEGGEEEGRVQFSSSALTPAPSALMTTPAPAPE